MNINHFNSELLTEEMVYDIKKEFDSFKKKNLEWEDMKEIVINMGYLPTNDEINDIIAETGNKIDFIYCLVIIGRIMRYMKSNNLKKELNEAFDTMDINKNGTLELDELKKYMKKKVKELKTNNNDLKILFDSIDADNDGHITKKEMFDFLEKIF